MYNDDLSEVFTLEDIMKEFGSGAVSTPTVPTPAVTPSAPVPEQFAPAPAPAVPMPKKGTVPFQTSRLPKISQEDLDRIELEQTQMFQPIKEQPVTEIPYKKATRKERKAAKAAEKEATRRAREAEKEAALEAKWAAKEAKQAARKGRKAAPAEGQTTVVPVMKTSALQARPEMPMPAPINQTLQNNEPEDELEAIIREFSAQPVPATPVMSVVSPDQEPAAEPITEPVAKESVVILPNEVEMDQATVEPAQEAEADLAPEEESSSIAEEAGITEEAPAASQADLAEPGMVNVAELEACVAEAAAEMELPEKEIPAEDSIVEKIPDPIHTAPTAPEPVPQPRPSRHQAAAQSAAEIGLMSDSELDAIIREFSDEPVSTYHQQSRLEALEQTLQDDLRINQSSDFFEEQFGGYAGPQPDPNEAAEPEETGFFAKLKKMLEDPDKELAAEMKAAEAEEQTAAADTDTQPEPEVALPADTAEDATVSAPDTPVEKSGFTLEIPENAEPGVPFTLYIPNEHISIPEDGAPNAETPTAHMERKPKRTSVPFSTAQKKSNSQILDEMGLDENDVDEELFPRRKKKAKKPPVAETPILTAQEGCQKYGKQLKAQKLNVQLGGILALVAFALTAYYSLDWQFIGFLANGAIVGWILNILLVGSCLVCMDVIRTSITAAKNRQFGLDILTGLAALVSLLDGVIGAIHGRVPYCATASVLLWLALWARYLQAEGMYRTMKVLDKNGVFQGIVRSENVHHGKAALFTDEVTEEEFMDHINQTPLSEQVLQIYTPLAALLTLILALVAAIKGNANFLQAWTPMLLAAVPASGLLCYSRTFAVLAKRLAKRGAALCGWYGACAMGNQAAVLLRDEDLFPNGMMEPNGVKSFNGYTGNYVVGYAAAVLNKAGSGLAPILESLLARDGGRQMHVDAIRLYENGGIGGKFGNDAILVGTLGFMRRMGVHMNPEAKVKRATYVSVNGELAGLIAIRYGASNAVKDALGILTRSGRTKPVMATCNVSITPKLLKQKFRIEPDRVEFPDLRERAELAARSADPDSTICAVMSKVHLATFADAAVGGRILQTVVKVGLIMAIISGLIGIAVLGVLSLTGAIAGLSAAYLLLFDLIWLIPVMLLTGWTKNY